MNAVACVERNVAFCVKERMLMSLLRRGVILFVFLLFAHVSVTAQSQGVVGGYYPAWRSSVFPPARLLMSRLTHIIHAFAWPDSDGHIHGYSGVPDPVLISTVHNGGGKISIGLGGYGNSDGFHRVSANWTVRKTFAGTLTYFLTNNGYDGVDIDWEWPTTVAERESLVSLVRDIRSAFDEVDSSMIITMAVPTSNWSGQWLNFPALLPYVNWFNAMTYDFHGSWTNHAGHNAPLYAPPTDVDGCVDQGIQYLQVTRGIPRGKLVMGLPFYAKEFLATDMYTPSSGETDILYADVVSRINLGWTYVWDALSQVPYLRDPSRTKVVTFDDSLSLTIKCQYANTKQLSGIMIWALGEDLVGQGQPLMEAVGLAMSGTSNVALPPREREVEQCALYANYPNPFNPSTTISYSLSTASFVTLKVFDVLGREVASLVNERETAGRHTIRFGASSIASGVYLYRIAARSIDGTHTFVETKAMVVAK
jgi:chitinase